MPDQDELFRLARSYLPEQGWFKAATKDDGAAEIELLYFDVLSEDPPIARLLLARGRRHFQLFVSWRGPEDDASARDEQVALLGVAHDHDKSTLVYEALSDDQLARKMLELATDGRISAQRARTVSSLVSHRALVFDERYFMKCYRVIEEGARTEVELLYGLDEVGFNALVAPVARWQAHGHDLALVREFLPNALEARALALTSLRDVLGGPAPEGRDPATLKADAARLVAQAGGDFAAETERLAATVAQLHLAIERAFGSEPLHARHVAAALALDHKRLSPELEARLLSREGDLGTAIRPQPDFHLRRAMRSESGWLIAGFGDDPIYRPEELTSSRRRGSPLEDVAALFFSLRALTKEASAQRRDKGSLARRALADAWLGRNEAAFWRGYLGVEAVRALLPADEALRDELVATFEDVRVERYEAMPAED